MRRIAVGFAFVCLVAPSLAVAQGLSPGAPGVPGLGPGGLAPIVAPAGPGSSSGPAWGLGATTGVYTLNNDVFVDLNLGVTFNISKFGMGLNIPMHLLVWDNSPKASRRDRLNMVFRKEEWDEAGDYLRIIRFLRWGQKGDLVYAQFGLLDRYRVGHGTIMFNYFNNITPDHFRPGLVLDVNTPWGGVETVVNDVTRPSVVGGRAYIRPTRFAFEESIFNGIAVGVTALADVNAPEVLRTEPRDPGDPSKGTTIAFDSRRNPVTSRTAALTMVGVDLEWRVIDWEKWKLTPYTDLNFVAAREGTGFHAGVMNELPLTPNFGLFLRAEYRYFTRGYMPMYFSSLYEIERWMMPGTRIPKLAWRADVNGRNGYFGEAYMNIFNIVTLGANFDDYQGPNNASLTVFADIPALKVVQFSAWYVRRNFNGIRQAFALDDRSMLAAMARWNISNLFFLQGSFIRSWLLDQPSGRYKAVDSFNFGFGVNAQF